VNGPVVGDALRDPANRINKLAATEKDDAKLMDELFLALLARAPTDAERAAGLATLRDPKSKEVFDQLAQEYRQRKTALDAYEKQLTARHDQWEEDLKRTPAWIALEPETLAAAGGSTLTKQPDHSVLASGKNPAPETYTITTKADLMGVTAIRLEVLNDPRLPGGGPGRAPNGNFVLSEFKVTAEPADGSGKARPVVFKNARATFSQAQFEIKKAIDNNPKTGWAVSPQFGRKHVAVFETKQPFGFPSGAKLTFTLLQQYEGKDHNIGRLRLSVTNMKPPVPFEGLPDNIARIITIPREKRTAEQQAAMVNYQRTTDPRLGQLQRAVSELVVPADARALAAQDLAWALLNSPAFLFNH
jgi:hypothetical protein